MDKKFDDIYIWNLNKIISLKFKNNIPGNTGNINSIFNSIKNHIVDNDYSEKIMIINDSMKIHTNFMKMLKILEYPNFDILQIGSGLYTAKKKINKINNIGALILDLEKLDIKTFDLSKPYDNLYDSGLGLFVHIDEINRLIKNGNYSILNKYQKQIDKILYINRNNLINLNKKHTKNIINPFWFIKQVYVSQSLLKFKKRIKEKYKLNDYKNNKDVTLFFGIYNIQDLLLLEKHQGEKFILYGGSDVDLKNPHQILILKRIKMLNIKQHYAISSSIKDRLKQLNINSKLIEFDLLNNDLFKKTNKLGDKVYIYNGNQGRQHIYGSELYKEIINRLPELDYIFSSDIKVSNDEMPNIYKKCFIGLRLTKDDGNANTVQEMIKMNIPVIHNGDFKESLKYRNIDDIEMLIRYNHIKRFMEGIENYKNILFICSDYPGYGGAATSNQMISDFMSKKLGKTCYNLYYNDENMDDVGNLYFSSKEKLKLKLFDLVKKNKIDLVIIRNFMLFNYKDVINCPIYFMIPGLFEPHLDKYYTEIDSKKEMIHYINKKIILTCKYVDKCLIASKHSQDILKEYFYINSDICYFNYIPYFGQLIENSNENRKYDYGIVVSNFNRRIKNIQKIIDECKKTEKNILLIGKNSNVYNYKNFTCIDLIPHNEIFNYLKQVKVILQDSFYESCSNVLVEARFCGCKIQKNVNKEDLIIKKIKPIIKKPIIKKQEIIKFNGNRKDIKVLVCSTQYPYYGGAATCAYHSIEYLRKTGYDVYGIFFDNTKDKDFDPDNMGGILKVEIRKGYNLKKPNLLSHVKDRVINYLGGYPDIIFAWNYGSPLIIKKIFKNSKIVYAVTGLPTVTLGDKSPVNNNISVQKVMTEKNMGILNDDLYDTEKKAIEVSDIILPYTKLIENFHDLFYDDYKEKLNGYINTAIGNVIEHTEKYQYNKKIDLVALSSNWYRLVKNLRLLLNIYERFPEHNKIIIGLDNRDNVSDEYKQLYQKATNMKNLKIYPLIKYEEAQKLVAESRLLVCPSYSESGPNVVIEAYLQKTQVVTSKNIGLYNYIEEYGICQDVYDVNEWENKIKYILDNFNKLKIPDLSVHIEKERNILDNFIIKNYKKKKNIRVLFICCDIPNIGGAATNTYNMLNNFEDSYGIFLSNVEGKLDPDNTGRVYQVNINENLEENFNKIYKDLEDKIDLVFYKNYKVFVYTHHLIKNKIKIFSPSGLRYLTNQISNDSIWFRDYDLNNKILIPNKNITYNGDNLLKFVRKNDKYLEDYVLNNCDYILPNSFITHHIIHSCKRFNYKLLQPIHLTNINFKIKKKLKNYSKRKYDLLFIAYNWSRLCKNYKLVRWLVERFELKDKKICIIGGGQKEYVNKNIDVIDYMEHKDLFKILEDTKVVVIPSFYDSNPNVLIEAVSYGCNVISSVNVGNAIFLNPMCIVENFRENENWLNKILEVKKSYSFKGYNQLMVKNDLYDLFNKFSLINKVDNIEQEAVGIYKLPAKFNDITNYEKLYNKPFYYKEQQLEHFMEHSTRSTDIKKNIYFRIFKKIIEEKQIKNSHYIFVDEFRQTPLHFMIDNINIWVLNKPKNLFIFNKAKFYFVRGSYYKFYKKLIPNSSYSVHYPATSLKFNYNIRTGEEIINKNLDKDFKMRDVYNFNLVLVHEDNIYKDMFKESHQEILEKFASDDFKYIEKERIYDIIMVGDATSDTKNHKLFIDFLNFCDERGFKMKVAYVSNKDILEEKYTGMGMTKSYLNIDLDFYDGLNPNELNELYNSSKINLLFSGRDACPRVISESLAAGCYNIALDTLSDGKFYFENELFGQLIGSKEAKVILTKGSSISYKGDSKLYLTLLKIIYEKKINHKEISIKSKNKYNIDVFYKKIEKFLVL